MAAEQRLFIEAVNASRAAIIRLAVQLRIVIMLRLSRRPAAWLAAVGAPINAGFERFKHGACLRGRPSKMRLSRPAEGARGPAEAAKDNQGA